MTDTAPCREQQDRDAVEDIGLADLYDCVGQPPDAEHAEEVCGS